MSDKERYAIIDKLIANYKKKEKEQKNKEAEAQITIITARMAFIQQIQINSSLNNYLTPDKTEFGISTILNGITGKSFL